MKTSLSRNELSTYIKLQLNHFFPDKFKIERNHINKYIDFSLQRAELCFSHVNSRYFRDEKGKILFNHLNGDQFAMFLYLLANTIYKNNGDMIFCEKVFQLNKLLHGIDAFYEVALPDIFLFVHPLATVLGRGEYADYLLVYQRCNVGSNKGIYPKLGKYVSLHPGASILGNCHVGDNCKISTGSLLLDKNIHKNSLYIGSPQNYEIKKNKHKSEFWQFEH